MLPSFLLLNNMKFFEAFSNIESKISLWKSVWPFFLVTESVWPQTLTVMSVCILVFFHKSDRPFQPKMQIGPSSSAPSACIRALLRHTNIFKNSFFWRTYTRQDICQKVLISRYPIGGPSSKSLVNRPSRLFLGRYYFHWNRSRRLSKVVSLIVTFLTKLQFKTCCSFSKSQNLDFFFKRPKIWKRLRSKRFSFVSRPPYSP